MKLKAQHLSSRAMALSNALLVASRLLSQWTSSASKALAGRVTCGWSSALTTNFVFELVISDAMNQNCVVPAMFFVVSIRNQLLNFVFSSVLGRYPFIRVQIPQRQR
jgi:hypothetical protein